MSDQQLELAPPPGLVGIAPGARLCWLSVDELQPHPENPNNGDVGAISQSIERSGFYGTIVAQAPRGQRKRHRILAGEHRWLAAKAEGVRVVPVFVCDVDDDTARAILAGDNEIARLAQFDEQRRIDLLSKLAAGPGLAGTGVDGDDLDAMIEAQRARDEDSARGNTGDDEVPDEAPPITQLGDVWQMGRHRLVCGDSTDPAVIARALDGAKADAVWTDPPYGVAYEGKTEEALTIENDALTPAQLRDLLDGSLRAAAHACRPGAVWYVAAPASPLFLQFGAVLDDLGIWRQTLVWLKDRFVLGRSDFHYRHEAIFYGWVPGAGHRRVEDRTLDTILEFARPSASRDHPTMKPVTLVTHCLRLSTAPGELVLDPFGGSGTTLVAADVLDRRAALVELDPRYCDVILKRWQTRNGAMPERDGTPVDFLAGGD